MWNLATLTHDPTRRPLLGFCLHWTEQRHHLAGRLGAALLAALLDQGDLRRTHRPRTVELTDTGHSRLSELLDATTTR